MREVSKVAKAIVLGAVVVLSIAAGGIAGATFFPKVITKTIETKVPFEVDVPVPYNVTQTVEVPTPVNVTVIKEVPVDNGNLKAVEQYIYDNNGEVSILTSDLKDSEIAQIVDRIVFVNDIKANVTQYVADNAADELNRYEVGGVTLKDSHIDNLKVYDDADKVNVTKVDFDNKDATVVVKTRFDYYDDTYTAYFTVKYEDGVEHSIDVKSVEKD